MYLRIKIKNYNSYYFTTKYKISKCGKYFANYAFGFYCYDKSFRLIILNCKNNFAKL